MSGASDGSAELPRSTQSTWLVWGSAATLTLWAGLNLPRDKRTLAVTEWRLLFQSEGACISTSAVWAFDGPRKRDLATCPKYVRRWERTIPETATGGGDPPVLQSTLEGCWIWDPKNILHTQSQCVWHAFLQDVSCLVINKVSLYRRVKLINYWHYHCCILHVLQYSVLLPVLLIWLSVLVLWHRFWATTYRKQPGCWWRRWWCVLSTWSGHCRSFRVSPHAVCACSLTRTWFRRSSTNNFSMSFSAAWPMPLLTVTTVLCWYSDISLA